MTNVSILSGRTFNATGNEFGHAISEIQNRINHEGPLRCRLTGISTVTGSRVDLTGEIVSAVRRTFPNERFLEAFMFQTENRVFTVGGRNASREDIAAETITML